MHSLRIPVRRNSWSQCETMKNSNARLGAHHINTIVFEMLTKQSIVEQCGAPKLFHEAMPFQYGTMDFKGFFTSYMIIVAMQLFQLLLTGWMVQWQCNLEQWISKPEFFLAPLLIVDMELFQLIHSCWMAQ